MGTLIWAYYRCYINFALQIGLAVIPFTSLSSIQLPRLSRAAESPCEEHCRQEIRVPHTAPAWFRS